MKILGVSCSPRKEKTTEYCLKKALEEASSFQGIETAFLSLAEKDLHGCAACQYCRNVLDCSLKDDFQKEILPLLKDPALAGIIIATPVYFGTMSAQCKAFLDRTLPLRRNGFMLKNKVAGVIAVGGSRNGGQELAVQAVHAALLIQNCIIVSDGCNTSHFGGTAWERHPGGIDKDEDGLETVKNLGKRVAETVLALNKVKSA
ncbi:MAG: flavodoxin family protein [Candidatus Aureabacteria bacterium]|nr:flavodoxin family protein [Candidatus Auribacterota bacterium]